jgi:N-acyl-D-aspartate/D-glutamate deacylase
MEGVEDIPGTALAEGITWEWQSFPEYLDALERKPRVRGLGTPVPRAAQRRDVWATAARRTSPRPPTTWPRWRRS